MFQFLYYIRFIELFIEQEDLKVNVNQDGFINFLTLSQNFIKTFKDLNYQWTMYDQSPKKR